MLSKKLTSIFKNLNQITNNQQITISPIIIKDMIFIAIIDITIICTMNAGNELFLKSNGLEVDLSPVAVIIIDSKEEGFVLYSNSENISQCINNQGSDILKQIEKVI